MALWVGIVVSAVALFGWVALTGRWRVILTPFRINPNKMTVRKLGLIVHDAESCTRVDRVLNSFISGFNVKLTSRRDADWESYCDSLPTLFQPFAHEGVAMALSPSRAMLFDADTFEESLVKRHPHMRYLYYVGLGFWSGMARHRPQTLVHRTRGLDPLHKYLCFDGYGFKHAFFDYAKKRDALRWVDLLPGYTRHAAYQGVGRALWFRYMSDRPAMIREMETFGTYAEDAAAGAGLASVFVYPDRLAVAQELGRAMPVPWQSHFHLGMCFALKARMLCDADQLEQHLAGADDRVRDAALASIRECDRIELQVRAEGLPNGYQEWRQRVSDWMGQHVEFPLVGIRRSSTDLSTSRHLAV